MKINNKGFTLIELLASIVILSILIAIMVPSVNYLIEKNKNDNYETLKTSIISAAKVYLSDNRYNITLNYDSELCGSGESEEKIATINEITLNDSKLPIKWLVDSKTLRTNNDGNIISPLNKNEKLNLSNSYVLVKYQCSIKDYTYAIEEGEKGTPTYKEYLLWE